MCGFLVAVNVIVMTAVNELPDHIGGKSAIIKFESPM